MLARGAKLFRNRVKVLANNRFITCDYKTRQPGIKVKLFAGMSNNRPPDFWLANARSPFIDTHDGLPGRNKNACCTLLPLPPVQANSFIME